ncbi:UDP-N-acetylglucosamine transferase subunit ALG14 homolog [Bradysia coprophila]|uniref:UDP-N-acetylglucosamine transferase subunit ALG14 homolog n=1 Tax=Bradysia coprophila TaxID=38358 RepID=UPI00187DD67D|nr:UDP-N-acetylglucosamine transferase subunit ALG14 homolog [Bradysia coprophila]
MFVVHCIILIVTLLAIRIFALLFLKRNIGKHVGSAKTLIVLGSGGHTTEMFKILHQLNKANYTPRIYVAADSDKSSHSKVTEFESTATDYKFIKIFRSRNVGQSYVSSVFTTLQAIALSIPVIYHERPDLVMCNGPGTCVPICLIAFLFRAVGINTSSRIVFIESFCRIKTLSLTGRIMIWFADLFVVHWQEQKKFSKKIQCFGQLI